MAIAFDNKAVGSYNSGGTSTSFSFTTSASANRLLTVAWYNDTTNPVTGITYNGVSLVMVGSTQTSATISMGMFYLAGPTVASGANSIVISRTNGNGTLLYEVASYTGARPALQPDAVVQGSSGTTTPFSTTITPVQTNTWVIGTAIMYNQTLTSGTNLTLRQGQAFAGILDSNGTVTPAGVHTIDWSCTGGSPTVGLYVMASFSDTTGGARYWVGGTGNWDASTTTNWAYASGGTGGASVPDSTNTVIFDASSGAGTVTLTTDPTTQSVTCTGSSITLNLSAHTLSLSGTGTVWTGGGTITAGTSTINLTNSSSSSKTFSGQGFTYYNLTMTSASTATYTLSGANTFNNFYLTGNGTGILTIGASNTFQDFKVDTPPHTVNFTAGTIQTLNTFTVSGTAGNLITLQSTSAGSSWYMVKSAPGTISCDYLSLQDSHVS